MNDNTIEIKDDDSGILLHIGFLYDHLAKIPDKRCARGKRYSPGRFQSRLKEKA